MRFIHMISQIYIRVVSPHFEGFNKFYTGLILKNIQTNEQNMALLQTEG